MSKDIIKWSELSRKLSGSDNSIRSNSVPKKYQKKVNRLLLMLDLWKKWANSADPIKGCGGLCREDLNPEFLKTIDAIEQNISNFKSNLKQNKK